ncbi:hypothetical protein V4E86_18245 [Burkholderia pseudomallei]|uniref:Uncharacterized protein n=1 Tax=Burkholderia mallei (strain NCTC 10229) TaxID=412022 RepID=A2S2J6_BURM9|nr:MULTISPECIES: hypothetical protein [Burkholderia]ABM50315.1 hypothetical protein BMASAVP1_A1492 [Burkholderia mallei SAVP1]ABN01734.1 hypothetical protein BMA10229_A0160 [Burkholderia mallei NCTC 10229]EDK56364.1 hypothetical protein BMAFMH_C0568 [Burkholderia mallei FMH]EDK60525.1 hypothetical protein BMAJHU_C0607 [Burkholderia mallei JHU]EDK85537.1 hypothetical protein BMA721280_A0660 [Burkholderia mallei 2002721280]EDP88822.1 hypothetical protein BMA10399_E0957 [Burkholderia mallei ATCC
MTLARPARTPPARSRIAARRPTGRARLHFFSSPRRLAASIRSTCIKRRARIHVFCAQLACIAVRRRRPAS